MAYPTAVKRIIDLEKRALKPADSAIKLENPREIGGVPFDGTENIDLPGVNVEGNQNTTGTASAWTVPRKLSLTGDVTGSVYLKGDSDIELPTTIIGGAGQLPAPGMGVYGAVVGSTASGCIVSFHRSFGDQETDPSTITFDRNVSIGCIQDASYNTTTMEFIQPSSATVKYEFLGTSNNPRNIYIRLYAL